MTSRRMGGDVGLKFPPPSLERSLSGQFFSREEVPRRLFGGVPLSPLRPHGTRSLLWGRPVIPPPELANPRRYGKVFSWSAFKIKWTRGNEFNVAAWHRRRNAVCGRCGGGRAEWMSNSFLVSLSPARNPMLFANYIFFFPPRFPLPTFFCFFPRRKIIPPTFEPIKSTGGGADSAGPRWSREFAFSFLEAT